ncbi:hypothetical protein RJ640_017500 [Escallonia rubra]|uniref:S-protein homolog n=1 Tax=Escallonia rubra TaxID=112253 RepID=A0AA88UJC0_9ASTE|nr:hypothetical protein RJ640_017500 [Escallonia rubra]
MKPKEINDRTNSEGQMKTFYSMGVILLILNMAVTRVHARVHVHVINRLGNGRVLNVHCQSSDDDLGYQSLEDDSETTLQRKDGYNSNKFNTEIYTGSAPPAYVQSSSTPHKGDLLEPFTKPTSFRC